MSLFKGRINNLGKAALTCLRTVQFLTGRQPFCKKSKSKWLAQERAQNVCARYPAENVLDSPIFTVVHVLVVAQSVAHRCTIGCSGTNDRLFSCRCSPCSCRVLQKGCINSGGQPQGPSPEFSSIFRHATRSVVRFPCCACEKTNFLKLVLPISTTGSPPEAASHAL
jgi:hypothetical protein